MLLVFRYLTPPSPRCVDTYLPVAAPVHPGARALRTPSLDSGGGRRAGQWASPPPGVVRSLVSPCAVHIKDALECCRLMRDCSCAYARVYCTCRPVSVRVAGGRIPHPPPRSSCRCVGSCFRRCTQPSRPCRCPCPCTSDLRVGHGGAGTSCCGYAVRAVKGVQGSSLLTPACSMRRVESPPCSLLCLAGGSDTGSAASSLAQAFASRREAKRKGSSSRASAGLDS